VRAARVRALAHGGRRAAHVGAVETVGQLDALTDVDVFVLEGEKGVMGAKWCTTAARWGRYSTTSLVCRSARLSTAGTVM